MSRLREAMRDRRVAAAVAVLAVLLVAYRFVSWRAKRSAPPAPASSPAAAEPAGGAQAAGGPAASTPGTRSVPSQAPGEVRWGWDRNPFLSSRPEGGDAGIGGGNGAFPPGGAHPNLPAGLRGTVISGGMAIAIFGNRLVPSGERIGEWMVTRVEPYSVTLRRGGEERTVELYRPAPGTAPGKRGGAR